ncbi:DNA mismatch repair endonuclease MutL [Breznakiella homolactica]|uniref:DNA mismatch repair protein MutL n=1 Tax=Breznakiella homolactica TaxID=2798577 RepID=A0A7T7XL55_9SPIR|nr:DNA mismatch repair endonuclease MutL [Breznakiella homolactica]QQO08415.1 DNA mismatch repair endonuclease MutL [Breznakiella homolactica]
MDSAGSGIPQSRIQILPPGEARKIAAGEVIDRPAALVREFIDNAIDAGAAMVELAVEGGGIRRTEVIDDGNGMAREDLELCWHTHATSKIRSVEDLSTSGTLGFRGEALAAAAAVSNLEIVSSQDGREAWRLEVAPGGGTAEVHPARRSRGTTVRSLGLFDALPARKRFLKREGAEANLCRQALIDKALAFPEISFRFVQDGSLKLFLPAAPDRKSRFGDALLGRAESAFLNEISCAGEGFSVTVVVGGPELFRRDRRQQYVIANGRRIQDFSLLQALEYGVQGWFPNGTHPIGAVFVDIDPALADFNIHPAKREVRFRDPGAIHHAVTSTLSNFMHHRGVAQNRESTGSADKPGICSGGGFRFSGAEGGSFQPETSQGRSGSLAMEALLEDPPGFAPPPRSIPDTPGFAVRDQAPPGYPAETGAVPPEGSKIRYAGRLFGLFILAERGDELYIIDQHAAHERILFDGFLSKPVSVQELLVPIPLETEGPEDDRFLEIRREELYRLGIHIRKDEDGQWLIEALPPAWRAGDRETVKEILDLKNAGEDLARRWAATLSCREAVKDGDYLDPQAALDLAERAFALPDPRCPHGRPIWMRIRREDIFRAVRRE